MVYDVEFLTIPEHIIIIVMKTKEFDKYIKDIFEDPVVYRFKSERYVFQEGDLVIKEQL